MRAVPSRLSTRMVAVVVLSRFVEHREAGWQSDADFVC